MRSLRIRVTALAAVVVAVTLVVTGVALVLIQRRLLLDDLDDALDDQAQAIADAARGDELPVVLALSGDDDDLAEVVRPDGSVIAASEPVEVDSARRVRTVAVETPDGPVIVRVSGSVDDVDDATAALARALLVAIPLATTFLAVLTWWLVGRTLRPVEESNRRQRQFVADASHELRSPLTRMRTELEVDLSHRERADPYATHQRVLGETVRMQQLVDDMAFLARSDAGAADPTGGIVDLDDVVLREAAMVRADRGLRVDLAGVSAAQVAGDAAQLSRAVRNLVANAARHARTTVRLSVSQAGSVATVAVADDGPGIPLDQRERVFERFTRLDEARSADDGGSGLGLAIARDIVERHGGSLVIDPDHASGTRFVITLPGR